MATPTGLRLPRYRQDPEGTHASTDFADYRSTRLRHPAQPLVLLPQMLTEVTGPLLGPGRLGEHDNDLTRGHPGEPQGQRIIVTGRLLDGDGRPIRDSLVETWQANAGGRYRHTGDRWPSPLDPNFDGLGRTLTDAGGRYEFTTIKPGAYPWKNHDNAWRPAHIHFSVFGTAFTQRLVTQMYFPDDPLFDQDPIFTSIPDEQARQRMIARFDLERTEEQWTLAFRFDIVVRGREQSVFEDEEAEQ
ncbi:protocatechuate 3,4-dioxygenase subunit beta [Amycolatopsis sp. PS_44_ISF1]|uniref:protocatechuate 3,4-dioxygenase subunit beta n=1 Tax=Amycolatopsis sp. PS_44_ISF1 TaxID=2974917 RepID=UPI0028DEADD7|nr:protocatechuate 3,4-dioxygenase subunit beta [Amycolatopsis sp. PS_44_ISF1]MDT8915551.1 protocatechuate 3,4-dioxygenase subunit beta [Amycolatopsis sp. PS_44_ISF1]